ncbi:MAG: hypothetical protein R2864_10665 [Syntrophotaleaceae bacterium]
MLLAAGGDLSTGIFQTGDAQLLEQGVDPVLLFRLGQPAAASGGTPRFPAAVLKTESGCRIETRSPIWCRRKSASSAGELLLVLRPAMITLPEVG